MDHRELVDAWREAAGLGGIVDQRPAGTITANEFAAMLGICGTGARDKLRQMALDGRAERIRVAGVNGNNFVYRLIPDATQV